MAAVGGIGGELAAVLAGLAELKAAASQQGVCVCHARARSFRARGLCPCLPAYFRRLLSPSAPLALAASDAMRPSVEVRLWARPGFYSAKLYDDFDAFLVAVAAAVRADRATIKLYYFRGAVVIAERIAITDTATLRAFASSRCPAVWVYEPATAGPSSPDELPAATLNTLPDAPSARSGRSSQLQQCFRAAVLKRDGAACVLCGFADGADGGGGGGGKSHLEAAHVVAVRTPPLILDAVSLVNIFDTQNGVVLCGDCHYWYDRHMWHVATDGTACVADALRCRERCERWVALHRRALRLPASPPLLALWPPPHYWAVQERLCLAAAAARAEHVAERPFLCDRCGARTTSERGLRRHKCRNDRHVFTPLQARAYPAAAATAGDGGARELFGGDGEVDLDAESEERAGGEAS